jgi:MFS family permease
MEHSDKESSREIVTVEDEAIGRDGSVETLKYNKDHTILLDPQPSNDKNDPLNWSQTKKNLVLFIISFIALLPDYGSATGAVTLIPQSVIWNLPEQVVNHSQVGNVFMLGAGGLFVTVCGAYFGRLPTLFWFVLNALWTAIWCTFPGNFQGFLAARILNGFFATVTQSGGMMFIEDMFFFHEHARKINIWSSFIILSPYMGPLFTAFIVNTQPWQVAFGLYSAMTGLGLILVVLFVDETYYDRRLPEQPPRKSRMLRLVGVEQWRSRHLRNSLWQAILRPVRVIMKPTVLLCSVFYLITFAWVVGINTTLAIFLTSLYGFGVKQVGFFYFAPIVAAILGELVGSWLHDFIANTYIRRHDGHLPPEVRLWAVFLAEPFIITGLIVMGFALERHYHYMVTAVGWGLYVFGIMIMTVGINAYNLDCYPQASGELTAWINFARTTAGFIVSYFMVEWVQRLGAEVAFGTQAAICGVGCVIMGIVYFFGARMRAWAGPLNLATN